jgi:membrane-bound lytic murein transglycosylase D
VLNLPEAHATSADPRVLLASLTPSDLFDSQKADRTYRVRKGDTLSRIASASGTTVATLMRLNDLHRANQVRVGQVLQLPGSQPRALTAAIATPPTPVVEPEDKLPSGTVTITDLPPPPEFYALPAERPASESAIALAQTAEPVSAAQADAFGPALLAGAEKAAMSADPSDYTVADDGTIEVQATETLGHYAEWLDVRATRLRELNRMRLGTPVVMGRRLKIDTARVTVDEFTQRRRGYHQKLQEDFFAINHIVGTEVHLVRPGESVWTIAQKYQNVPIWLLRQYNPDIDFYAVRPRTKLELPLVETTVAPRGPVAGTSSGPMRRAASRRT